MNKIWNRQLMQTAELTKMKQKEDQYEKNRQKTHIVNIHNKCIAWTTNNLVNCLNNKKTKAPACAYTHNTPI